MDENTFKNEVRRLRPQLLNAARHHTADAEWAEDVVQDALLRMWQLRDTLHLPLAPLAFVLVRNLAIDALRRQKHTTTLDQIADPSATTAETDPRYERVMKLLQQLPPMQQTVFRLRHLSGMAFEDIAEITATTPEAVRQAVSRARKTILKNYNATSWKRNN